MRRHTDYEKLVAAYHLLSPAERRELDAHLRECSLCAADLAAYRRMDADLAGLQGYRASAAMRARVNAALSHAPATPAPKAARPEFQQPVIRQQKPARAAWTWERALVPLVFVLLFALAIGLSLPRSGGNDRETLQPQVAAPPQQAEIIKLTFACEAIGAFANYDEWQKVIAAFEAENPDITVELTSIPLTATDAATYRQAMSDMASKADVFCAMPSLEELNRSVVADLAPYIADDPTFNANDIYPGLLVKWDNGAILSVPTYFRPMFIGYNPEIFDRAGLPYPQPGWTWDEFLATATALTRRNGDEVEQWGYYEVGAPLFSGRLWADWSADLSIPPDYATTAQTLAWYRKLYVDARAAAFPPSLEWKAGDALPQNSLEPLIKAGKVAMWDGGWSYEARGTRFAPFPGNANAFMSQMSGLVMSGQTAHPDAAWRLLSYLSRHLPDGEVPARRSLAEAASFWNGLDADGVAAYRYILDQPEQPYTSMPDYYASYLEAAKAVAKGEKTVEQALADLDAQVRLRGRPQADGDALQDYLARVGARLVNRSPYNALVVQSSLLEPDNPAAGIVTDTGTRCWHQMSDTLDPCSEASLDDAIRDAAESYRPVVYFAPGAQSDRMVVYYEVRGSSYEPDAMARYRVTFTQVDGKWREELTEEGY